MNVLIAPDKFKGSLTATEAAEAMAEAVKAYNPDWNIRKMPIADGGEGTAELLTAAHQGEMQRAQAADALFRPVSCEFGLSGDGKTAFIDISEASGLQRLSADERHAFRCSTQGTGQLIVSALNRKCKRIVLGLGGSATIDCGIGIAQALGVVFKDEEGRRISPISGNLGRIEFIETQNLRISSGQVEIILLADVENPLLGPEGAIQFGAQKGLNDIELVEMQAALQHFATLMEAKFGTKEKMPGMGAAGGAALSCLAFLGAKLAPGARYVLEMLGADSAIAEADLILTGEGKLDAQSLKGKAPIALASRAVAQGKQVVAVCGQIDLAPEEMIQAGISNAYSLAPGTENDHLAAKEELKQRTLEALRELAPSLKA